MNMDDVLIFKLSAYEDILLPKEQMNLIVLKIIQIPDQFIKSINFLRNTTNTNTPGVGRFAE